MSVDKVSGYYRQGLTALDAESFPSAVDWFTRVLELEPDHVKAYTSRAKAYELEGQLRDALLDAREIVRLTPASHKGYLIGGRLLRLAGKFVQAQRMLDQALVRAGRAQSTKLAIEREIALTAEAHAQSSACPISRLPTELFVHVISLAHSSFSTSLPTYHTSASDTRPRLNPLVAASGVCRHWNAALRDSPTLWNTLRVDGQLASRRVQAKVRWWVAKATATPLPGRDEEDELEEGETRVAEPARRTRPGLGVTTLVITRAQHLGAHGLKNLLELLVALDAIPALKSFHISWMGPTASSAEEQRQITAAFNFLARRAPTTLKSLTLHTPSHLRLMFSLPRFGAHFAQLEALEVRAARSSVRAEDVYLPPSSLPEYNGEDDWPPTKITRLVLVGPIWRLRFEDGTMASPTLAREDVPLLRQVELGPTTPPMTWDLLSASGLESVILTDHLDQPMMVDPKVGEALKRVKQLWLVRSASLATRLLKLALAQQTTFHQLTSVNLRSASLTTAQMALFSATNAPSLTELHLSCTAAVHTQHGEATLELPLCPSVKVLDVSQSSWLNEALPKLAETLPKLARINLSGTEVTSRPLLEFVRATLVPTGEGGDKFISRLVELNLVGCNKVEMKAIEWIKERTAEGVLKYSLTRGDEDKRLAKHGGQW